ncbi:DUF5626 family protein [Vagococcus hydrophili]|uniref:DUF5626 family protein n=1 Tax=Vagococcus hydrophili TaxID=2714947 RepID=A0A6G8ASC9_9ENTE|nr:DUF5626 family protein [Vagococcus hydrophili]QIL47833.1 DUF5626 family protein [Vagococcus hydrophili]
MKNKLFKTCLVLMSGITLGTTVLSTATVFANELSSSESEYSDSQQLDAIDEFHILKEVEFDLKETGIQTKKIIAEDGTEAIITIEPEFNPMSRVSNGTYKIYYYAGIFNCSFRIRVSGNNITSAYDGTYSHWGVSVKSSSLRRESNKRATYYFEFGSPVWDFGGWNGWLRATINGSNKLVTTVK